ncbi:MAG TPA: hypothetical protein VKX17_05730 [Planctomycetota bacterium]|nr:hypothetical protein [Planctomycetota bacterium]
MLNQLTTQISALLSRPRSVKPQTERQVTQYIQEHGGDAAGFLARAAELLEEHELEILFAPEFTPTLEEQAAVSDLLASWRPTSADLEKLNADLCAAKAQTILQMPDGAEVKIPLHEVMISRFVKLMRLDQAPDFKIASSLQDTLPSELYQAALALMRQRGFTLARQTWFASFVAHLARRHPLNTNMLAAAAQFILAQTDTATPALLAAAQELVRAAKGSAEYAQAGRVYWSPDVAQHHQYRGQGRVDQALVKQKLEELAALEAIAAGLETYEKR